MIEEIHMDIHCDQQAILQCFNKIIDSLENMDSLPDSYEDTFTKEVTDLFGQTTFSDRYILMWKNTSTDLDSSLEDLKGFRDIVRDRGINQFLLLLLYGAYKSLNEKESSTEEPIKEEDLFENIRYEIDVCRFVARVFLKWGYDNNGGESVLQLSYWLLTQQLEVALVEMGSLPETSSDYEEFQRNEAQMEKRRLEESLDKADVPIYTVSSKNSLANKDQSLEKDTLLEDEESYVNDENKENDDPLSTISCSSDVLFPEIEKHYIYTIQMVRKGLISQWADAYPEKKDALGKPLEKLLAPWNDYYFILSKLAQCVGQATTDLFFVPPLLEGNVEGIQQALTILDEYEKIAKEVGLLFIPPQVYIRTSKLYNTAVDEAIKKNDMDTVYTCTYEIRIQMSDMATVIIANIPSQYKSARLAVALLDWDMEEYSHIIQKIEKQQSLKEKKKNDHADDSKG